MTTKELVGFLSGYKSYNVVYDLRNEIVEKLKEHDKLFEIIEAIDELVQEAYK